MLSLIIVDSVAALVPKAELEGEVADSQVALVARMMGKALRKLTPPLRSRASRSSSSTSSA